MREEAAAVRSYDRPGAISGVGIWVGAVVGDGATAVGRGGVAPGGIRARSPLAAKPRRAEADGIRPVTGPIADRSPAP